LPIDPNMRVCILILGLFLGRHALIGLFEAY
jgi:hypothetical protein